MGSANIRAKVKRGLARAQVKTGSSSTDNVYLVKRTSVGGTPLNPSSSTEQNILLVDAIFQEYDAKTVDVNILAGDRRLVTNSDVVISQGDVIRQGGLNYTVIDVDIKAPTSDVLAYISQVRIK